MLRTGNFCKKITSNLLFCLGKIQLESIIVLLCVNFNYPRVKIETIDIYPRGQVPPTPTPPIFGIYPRGKITIYSLVPGGSYRELTVTRF